MKKLLVAVIVLVAGSVYLYLAGYIGAYLIAKGTTLSTQTYANTFFDISVALPSNWQFRNLDDGELQNSFDNLGFADPKLLELAKQTKMYSAFPRIDDGRDDPTSIVILIEKTSATGNFDYLHTMEKSLKEMTQSVNLRNIEAHYRTASGKEFFKADSEVTMPNGYVLRSRYLFVWKRPFVFLIQITQADNEYAQLEKMIH